MVGVARIECDPCDVNAGMRARTIVFYQCLGVTRTTACPVFVAFGILGLLAGWLPAFDDRHDIMTFGSSNVRWIGVALFAVGGLIRLIPVFQLGRRFSGLVAIQPGHELATDGAYRFIRHPSYFGMILTILGWALAFGSGIGLIMTALMLVPMIGRIRAEEALLLDQFGGQYARYRARTWRLIPFVF